jgi:hypothetical protein
MRKSVFHLSLIDSITIGSIALSHAFRSLFIDHFQRFGHAFFVPVMDPLFDVLSDDSDTYEYESDDNIAAPRRYRTRFNFDSLTPLRLLEIFA